MTKVAVHLYMYIRTVYSRYTMRVTVCMIKDEVITPLCRFGESTWDLVIFIGTGALGPLGSFQTFLLAVVNVLMQVGRAIPHIFFGPYL